MSGDLEIFVQAVNGSASTRCVGVDDYTLAIAELTVSAITLPLHLFVVISMIVYRDLVKRNVVNIYAGNVIFSGVIGGIWRIYVNAEDLAERDRVEFVANRTTDVNDWQEFKLGFNIVFTLVTSGSVGLVINAMRSIQFRVHKTVGGVSNLATETICETREKCSRWGKIRQSHKIHPKSWAAFYIFLVWMIPLLLTALTAILGDCDQRCHCAGLNVPHPEIPGGNCIANDDQLCSSLLPPLGKLTLNVAFGVWLLYWIILTVSIVKTKMDLLKIRQQRIHSMKLLNDRREAKGEKNSENSKESPNKTLVAENETDKQNDKEHKRSVAIKLDTSQSTSTRISGSIFIRSLRRNFKLLTIMYISYVIGSAPVSITALVDGVTDSVAMSANSPGMVIIFILPLISEAICTIMVCMYLSGVKAATRSLLVALCRCFQ